MFRGLTWVLGCGVWGFSALCLGCRASRVNFFRVNAEQWSSTAPEKPPLHALGLNGDLQTKTRGLNTYQCESFGVPESIDIVILPLYIPRPCHSLRPPTLQRPGEVHSL